MTLRSTLFHVAALASAAAGMLAAGACSSTSLSAGSPTTDAGNEDADASPPTPVGCGGCNCGQPSVPQGKATAAQACAIAAEMPGEDSVCRAFCGVLNDGGSSAYFCTVPDAYKSAFQAARQDASAGDADAGDAGTSCPAWSDDVVVQCGYTCLGRRTSGIEDPTPCDRGALGAVFANRAYLEAVSVHAFARLERELAFHRAPSALQRKARRARRDEIRHTRMTMRLSRRFGANAALPAPPAESPVRSLFDIARENAVEGCVRETYGAVVGLVEAARSSDGEVRHTSMQIARDECRHAELARQVARWLDARLEPEERAAVDRAAARAIADLSVHGDRRIVELLDAHVWSVGV